MAKKIGVLVGSLREGSYSKHIALNICKLLPEGFEAELLDISALALYSEDLDEGIDVPGEWQAFREAVKTKDAYLFVTPEYNRSVPGVLKNALDVASRPYGQSAFGRRPAAVASCSPGTMGGFGANHALRQSLVFLDLYPMQQPEMYLARVDQCLNGAGDINNDSTKAFLQKFADDFAAWVLQFYGEG